MKYIYSLALIYIFLGCGIYDMGKAEAKQITGKIYVINLNIPEDLGYYIIYREPSEKDKYLLNDFEYVDYLFGNDSLLLIKSNRDSIYTYHLLKHKNGLEIKSIISITESEFAYYKQFIAPKYYFKADSIDIPRSK